MKKCGYHSIQNKGKTWFNVSKESSSETCAQTDRETKTKQNKIGNTNDFMAMREKCNEDMSGGKLVRCKIFQKIVLHGEGVLKIKD